jgi:hypothetical protein
LFLFEYIIAENALFTPKIHILTKIQIVILFLFFCLFALIHPQKTSTLIIVLLTKPVLAGIFYEVDADSPKIF